jgi:hypothetical protein
MSESTRDEHQTKLEHKLVAIAEIVEKATKKAEKVFDSLAPKCKYYGTVALNRKTSMPSCSLKESPFDWSCSFDSCPFTSEGRIPGEDE